MDLLCDVSQTETFLQGNTRKRYTYLNIVSYVFLSVCHAFENVPEKTTNRVNQPSPDCSCKADVALVFLGGHYRHAGAQRRGWD